MEPSRNRRANRSRRSARLLKPSTRLYPATSARRSLPIRVSNREIYFRIARAITTVRMAVTIMPTRRPHSNESGWHRVSLPCGVSFSRSTATACAANLMVCARSPASVSVVPYPISSPAELSSQPASRPLTNSTWAKRENTTYSWVPSTIAARRIAIPAK